MAVSRNIQLEINYYNHNFYNVTKIKDKYSIKESINEVVNIPDAYCKIDGVIGTKEKIQYTINIYDSDKETCLKTETFSFIPEQEENSVRWDKQAYRHYKSIYADCIDLLDEGQTP